MTVRSALKAPVCVEAGRCCAFVVTWGKKESGVSQSERAPRLLLKKDTRPLYRLLPLHVPIDAETNPGDPARRGPENTNLQLMPRNLP
jgi:hypothetical protein